MIAFQGSSIGSKGRKTFLINSYSSPFPPFLFFFEDYVYEAFINVFKLAWLSTWCKCVHFYSVKEWRSNCELTENGKIREWKLRMSLYKISISEELLVGL